MAKLKDYLFVACAVLLIFSALGYFWEKSVIPYVYAVSGAGVAAYFLTNLYKGENRRLKRLNFQQVIAALLLPVSSYFMFQKQNEWFLFLFVSAILLVYVIFVRDYEEKKDNGQNHKPSK